jgi:hypothetical protein
MKKRMKTRIIITRGFVGNEKEDEYEDHHNKVDVL